MRFFDITPVGKIVTRLTNDVDAVNDVFANIGGTVKPIK